MLYRWWISGWWWELNLRSLLTRLGRVLFVAIVPGKCLYLIICTPRNLFTFHPPWTTPTVCRAQLTPTKLVKVISNSSMLLLLVCLETRYLSREQIQRNWELCIRGACQARSVHTKHHVPNLKLPRPSITRTLGTHFVLLLLSLYYLRYQCGRAM